MKHNIFAVYINQHMCLMPKEIDAMSKLKRGVRIEMYMSTLRKQSLKNQSVSRIIHKSLL